MFDEVFEWLGIKTFAVAARVGLFFLVLICNMLMMMLPHCANEFVLKALMKIEVMTSISEKRELYTMSILRIDRSQLVLCMDKQLLA